MSSKDKYVRFARHEDIPQFEKEGWVVSEGTNLSDCHHGEWSVIMEKEAEAEPDPFHWDAIDDRGACVTVLQPMPDDIYLMFSKNDRTCERRRISENQCLMLIGELHKAYMAARAERVRQGT